MTRPSSISWDLCDTEFLDPNTTWYTEHPRFSPCFRDTLLVWAPACVLLIAITIESLGLRRANKKTIPWNKFNSMRISLVAALAISKLLELVSYIYYASISATEPHPFNVQSGENLLYSVDIKPADLNTISSYTFWAGNPTPKSTTRVLVLSALLAPIIQLLSYFSLAAIYHFQRRLGRHTSGSVWFYLSVSVICGFIDYYSLTLSLNDAPITIIGHYVDCAHWPVLLILFILECRGDTPVPEQSDDWIDDKQATSPELTASYCSSITFWWYNKFLWYGYKCRLRIEDLWRTLPRDRASELVPVFRRAWLKPATPSTRTKPTYRLATGEEQQANHLLLVLFKIFWPKILYTACLKLVNDGTQFLTPMILKRILVFMNAPEEPIWHGILFAVLFFVAPTVQTFILNNYFHHVQVVGYHVKSMLIGTIYRKSLLLSGSSRQKSTSGEIVNLMAVDTQRFQDFLLYFNLILGVPLQMMIAIFLLYRELGWPVFTGVLCMCFILPANAYLAKRIKHNQGRAMKTKDERVKQMNEILGGIKVIKLYAWESSFISRVFNLRNQELAILRRILTFEALQEFLWNCCPMIVACVTFAVYVSVDPANVLDASKAFVSMALFNLLRFPLNVLPGAITYLMLALVSARRTSDFLNSDELVQYVGRSEEPDAIAIEGGTLAWAAVAAAAANKDDKDEGGHSASCDDDDDTPPPPPVILKDIDLHVKAQSFVAIVGQVASGKSSLLSAILGEMHRISGRFNICKSLNVAYVPQQAWIQNMTVRDNILFGSEYDEERYQQVLSACALRPDLDTLPGGDQAEIGEKGINLSGGQKQRVSLARACYSNSDIYLLDDPLSALDSHVARHVYDEVLSSTTGLLRDKTRVLCTNSLFVLPYVDQIVALKGGKVIESGSYRELFDDPESYLADIMRQYSSSQKDKDLTTDARLDVSESAQDPIVQSNQPNESAQMARPTATKSDAGKLIDEEKLETGAVDYRVYLKYFRAISWPWTLAVVGPLVAASAVEVANNMWLSIWVGDAEDPARAKDVHLRTFRLIVYTVLGGIQCFLVLTESLATCQGGVRASRRLHASLLERVMHSPMSFFDTTPIGRVVNRFSKDIDVVDSTLPTTFQYWFTQLLEVVSTLFVICYSFPAFLIIMTPLLIAYLFVQRVFTATTRQLKRLESITRSPIYSNFNETLSGASAIRAYDCVDRFVQSSDKLIDVNQTCSYTNIMANRWLTLRLVIFGNLVAAIAALLSVYYKGTISAGVAGLTISYCLNVSLTLSWVVRQTSELKTNIVSVERISEYLDNKQEDRWVKEENRPPVNWPSEGTIDFQQYSTRYREDLELALRGVSLRVEAREKIGIVGRTGSGKSSLSLALFRLLEPSSGAILIDGQNLAHYGLHDIRSKLTIIPQDPVLFSGTLRFNLDPLNLHADFDIWHALERANLKPYVSDLKEGLDYKVSENGENFSVGQKQLVCLARAILRKSKILILDEATASVDLETDTLVQKTIRDIFSECTIITIAHRLHTILDSDRILLLDSGRVCELDSPAKLIEDQNSAFASLVRDAGVDTSAILNKTRRLSQGTAPASNIDKI